ncbi:MAG: transposase DNA-binding-containing protein [Candidatus Electryonea clarkiae]|nr:transposase DNA-binding-containing protein [Candidatus Electryonea clarkiae]
MIRNTPLWSKSVFGHAHLKDIRMVRRLVQMGAAIAFHPGWSLLRCCEGDRAQEEGVYRFIENSNVSVEGILDSGFSSTVSAKPSKGTLVLIHDTTRLGYDHKVASDLGPIGPNPDIS